MKDPPYISIGSSEKWAKRVPLSGTWTPGIFQEIKDIHIEYIGIYIPKGNKHYVEPKLDTSRKSNIEVDTRPDPKNILTPEKWDRIMKEIENKKKEAPKGNE